MHTAESCPTWPFLQGPQVQGIWGSARPGLLGAHNLTKGKALPTVAQAARARRALDGPGDKASRPLLMCGLSYIHLILFSYPLPSLSEGQPF